MHDDNVQLVRLSDVKPSMMFWIKASHLKFNEWHRPVDEEQVQKIAGDFREEYLGPLLVNRREDLSLWCYDGRQRLDVACRLFGAEVEVLCKVHVGGSRRWEARSHEQANASTPGFSSTDYALWSFALGIRRDRERLRDALGGRGAVACDRLMPGYDFGDPVYLTEEERAAFGLDNELAIRRYRRRLAQKRQQRSHGKKR